MPLYVTCGRPKCHYPLCSVATLETAFAAQVIAGCEYVIIMLNPSAIFVADDVSIINLLDFTGFSTTRYVAAPINLES